MSLHKLARGPRLYRWRVGEDLWTQLRPQDFLDWRPFAVSGSTVYISPMNRKLVRSTDEGDTWTEIGQNLPNWKQLFAHDFQADISDLIFVGGTVYAKFYNGLFRSGDGARHGHQLLPDCPMGTLTCGLLMAQRSTEQTLMGSSA